MNESIIIYMTVRTQEEGIDIAKELLDQKLIACANVFHPHIAVYEWDGEKRVEGETAMILKTTKNNFEGIEELVKSKPSYECPCLISFQIGKGHVPFLQWIEKQTAPL